MLLHLLLSNRCLRLSSFLFILVFFILFCGNYLHHSIFQLTYSSSSVILLLIPCSVFLISLIMLVLTVCFFFSTSRSLLNFFSWSVCIHSSSEILDHLYYRFSEFFFFRKIVCLLIYMVFRFLPCSLIYNIFLYHLTFIDSGNCVSVLLGAWPEPYNTGSCRQLGGVRAWCQDNDQWGKLILINITWGLKSFGCPEAWTWHSHHRGLGSTPSLGPKAFEDVHSGKTKQTKKKKNKK